jgi:hypothetical protein
MKSKAPKIKTIAAAISGSISFEISGSNLSSTHSISIGNDSPISVYTAQQRKMYLTSVISTYN